MQYQQAYAQPDILPMYVIHIVVNCAPVIQCVCKPKATGKKAKHTLYSV